MNGKSTAISDILKRYMANRMSYQRAKTELQEIGLSLTEIEKLLEAIEYAEEEDVDELVEDEDDV